MIVLIIIFWILQLAFAFLVLFLTIAFVTGAPFVPSTPDVSETMIRLAGIKKGMTVYDLGSGDGRLLCMALKKGAARAVGFEINPFLVWYTRLRAFRNRCGSRMKVYWKNFWNASFTDADVVFVYLLPWRMEALKRKLTRTLKPGSLVVSNSFIFRNWKIYRQDHLNHVYVFRIPKTPREDS